MTQNLQKVSLKMIFLDATTQSSVNKKHTQINLAKKQNGWDFKNNATILTPTIHRSLVNKNIGNSVPKTFFVCFHFVLVQASLFSRTAHRYGCQVKSRGRFVCPPVFLPAFLLIEDAKHIG